MYNSTVALLVAYFLAGRHKRPIAEVMTPFNASYIPYVIDPSVKHLEKLIKEGIDYYEAHTCANFVRLQPNETAGLYRYLLFKNQGGCAMFPKNKHENYQVLSLGEGCEDRTTILHELGHWFGLIHTHVRFDRDNYLNITRPDKDRNVNFKKIDASILSYNDMPYDYMSVMHYTSTDLSSPKVYFPAYELLMGRPKKLAFTDKAILNLWYCSDICKTKITCENKGYQNSKKCDECVCPHGFGGPTCAIRAGSDDPNTDCGATLNATSKWQTIIKVFRETTCDWWIHARKGKRVQLDSLRASGDMTFNDRCSAGGLEVKLYDDIATGFRVCGRETVPKIPEFVSKSNRVILHGYVKNGQKQYFELRYREV